MKRVFFLLMVLSIFGCSWPGKPSQDEMEALIVERYARDGGDAFVGIENFANVGGVKTEEAYVAEVKYDLVFKKSAREIVKIMERDYKVSAFRTLESGAGVMTSGRMFGNFDVGHRITREEKVTFAKPQDVWVIQK